MHYLVTAVSVQPHRLKNFGPSLGCDYSDIQVLPYCQTGHLYNQCHRKPELIVPQDKPPEKRVPKPCGPYEGSVPCHHSGNKEMDYACQKLGRDYQRTQHHVS